MQRQILISLHCQSKQGPDSSNNGVLALGCTIPIIPSCIVSHVAILVWMLFRPYLGNSCVGRQSRRSGMTKASNKARISQPQMESSRQKLFGVATHGLGIYLPGKRVCSGLTKTDLLTEGGKEVWTHAYCICLTQHLNWHLDQPNIFVSHNLWGLRNCWMKNSMKIERKYGMLLLPAGSVNAQFKVTDFGTLDQWQLFPSL